MQTELTARHHRWRVNVFAATWMSYAGFYFCRKAFGVLKPDLIISLQVDDLQLAYIWTAYLIAYMFGQFLAGWLGVRVACRRLLLSGMMISLLCNVIFGFSVMAGPEGYWPFLIFMIINGLAQATGWPGNIGTLAHWFNRQERGTLMGWWATCYQLGSMGAKAFAAFMLGLLGMQWSFFGASCVLFIVWIAFYFLQRDRPEDIGLSVIVTEIPQEPISEGEGQEHELQHELQEDREHKLQERDQEFTQEDGWPASVKRTLILMGLTYFSFKFLRYCIDSWASMMITENFQDTSTEVAGYISTIFDWLGFIGVICAGWASDRFFNGRRSFVIFVMSIGMFLSIICLWFLGTTSLLNFAILLGILGFCLFGPDSLLSGVGTIDVGSKRRAVLAAGIVNGIGSSGPILQELMIGYIRKVNAYTPDHGLNDVFTLLIIVAGIGLIGTSILWWRVQWGKSRL